MLTDLIFDFFGTLAGYTAGPFRDERFDATHGLLAEHGYPLAYDRFVREYTRVSDALEQQARATGVEFHMDDAGRAFFAACFELQPPPELIQRFSESFAGEWNRGTVFYPEIQPLLARLARHYRLSIISNTLPGADTSQP